MSRRSAGRGGRSRPGTATGRRAVAAPTSETRTGAAEPVAARAKPGERSFGSGGTLSRSGILLLVALTILWGLNWPAMKLAVLEIPVWTFRSLCLVGGGTILLALTTLSGERLRVPLRVLPALILAAVFNITLWHVLTAYALLNTGSGRASIIGYTMPLWASVLSVLFLNVRIGWRELIALTLGMAALLLLVLEDLGALGATPTGPLLIGLAAFSWAIGTLLVKRFAPWPVSVMALTGLQQLIGAIPIVIGWWLLEPVPDFSTVSTPALLSLVYTVTIAMVFCHTAYFKLVELLPAHVAAISTLGIPIVGVISGALLLGEPVGLAEVAALLLVVTGLTLLTLRAAPG